jgi:hypothetical protein
MTHELLIHQPGLPGLCPVTEAVDTLADASGAEERGAVFTRPEVVAFMLDLVGYTTDRDLHQMSLLEPSFGAGDFLLPAVDRLLTSWQGSTSPQSLAPCIRAVELHRKTFDATHDRLAQRLRAFGFSDADASALVTAWLRQGDFLLSKLPSGFSFVVGNPPYVRQELIPAALITEYRRRFSTVYDRADLYIPFIERSLELLSENGQFAFICADRWMKNRYGGPLRALVSRNFHLRAYVDMVDAPAFQSDVSAYPAITLIEKAPSGTTLVVERPTLEPIELARLARILRSRQADAGAGVLSVDLGLPGSAPWVLRPSAKTDLVRRVESEYPTLEEAGCKVGIGVATGADKCYIGRYDELDVEPSRKLPLATTRDIATGRVQWRGQGVINPFNDDGSLVDLARYPKLRAHLEKHRGSIASRHVAQRTPANWYRTIDRITPALAARPKLLIPDIKGKAHVAFEDGKLYPHHNLYYVVADEWELRALQAVLLSKLAGLFVSTYSTKMRGGYLRFQAQYLRRIRIPKWAQVPQEKRLQLIHAAERLDFGDCDAAVADLYGLSASERTALDQN